MEAELFNGKLWFAMTVVKSADHQRKPVPIPAWICRAAVRPGADHARGVGSLFWWNQRM